LKWLEIEQDNLRMKFSALNVDFSNSSLDPEVQGGLCKQVSEGYPSKSGCLSVVGLSSVKMVADRHRHPA